MVLFKCTMTVRHKITHTYHENRLLFFLSIHLYKWNQKCQSIPSFCWLSLHRRCVLSSNRDTVALVCSLFPHSSLYTVRGREREGTRFFRMHRALAQPCQHALCSAANPSMPLWIFHLPSQETKGTFIPTTTYTHTRRTFKCSLTKVFRSQMKTHPQHR